MIESVNQDVTLGGLNLMVAGEDVPYPDGYTLRVTGEDASLGNAQPVVTTLFSMLAAGSIVSRDRDDNRQPTIIIEVVADYDDGLALAKGEAALQAVCDRRVELVWRPPQTGAPVAVFDVVDSKLDLIYSDMDELNLIRGYRLTMTALPYARSQTSVVAEAVIGADTIATVNNADTTTGWASVTSAVTDIGTAIRVDPRPGDFLADARISGFSSSVLDTRPYVVVEWRTDLMQPSGTIGMSYQRSSVGYLSTATKMAEFPLEDDWKRTYFRLQYPADTVELMWTVGPFYGDSSAHHLDIRDVSATSFLPTIGTGRQQIRLLEVGGSVTTQGSITVEHESSDVGETIIYTLPLAPGELHMPALSAYVTGGVTPVADPALMSGKEWTITGGAPFTGQIPVSALPPGEYTLMARIKSAVATTLFDNYLRAIVVGSPNQMVKQDARDVTVAVTPNVWTIVNLGIYTLPVAGLGPNDFTSFVISGDIASTDSLKLDEAWLFSHEGALTITKNLTWKRFRVNAPSLDYPSGAVWASDNADFLNAWSPADQLVSRQHHNLRPGYNHLYVATTSALDPKVRAEHYNRHNTFPAD
jgi:hypothetical protein